MPTIEELCQDTRKYLAEEAFDAAVDCFSQALKYTENPVLLLSLLKVEELNINADKMFERGWGWYYKETPNPPEAKPFFGVAAILGNVQAQIAMGIYYATQATNKWSVPARWQSLMIRLANRKNPVVTPDDIIAIKWWTLAAENGSLWAQHRLGWCYFDGSGVEKNHAEAIKWFLRAAEQDEPWSQYRLGLCYQGGEGVEKDDRKAFEWFNKAAEQGIDKAQFETGKCYEQGGGVSRDADKAKYWYIKAARQGVQEARDLLKPEDYQFHNKWEDEIDYDAYIQQAEQGDHEAQYMIGCYYYKAAYGKSVYTSTKNYQTAVKWFRKALDKRQGYIKSRYMLGLCFLEGNGVERDEAKGIKLLTMMAEAGDEDAMLKLGWYYRGEKGCYDKAKQIYSDLAERGNAEGQFHYGLYLEKDDPKKALSLFHKSVDGGFEWALTHLKSYYTTSFGGSNWNFCELGFEKDNTWPHCDSIVNKKYTGQTQMAMEENLTEKKQETEENKNEKGFSVTFEDGTVIHESKSVDTFVKSLQKIGLKRINESRCPEHSKYKLVDTKEKNGEYKEQKKIDGYYIYTSLGDDQKVDDLYRISDYLGLNLKIEEYGATRGAKTKLRVTFPDENLVIEKNTASATFIEAIQHMDLWCVMVTGIVLHGTPVVSRKMSEKYPKESTPINGFYVTYHGNNDVKKEALEKIAERLEKRIEVEIV